MFIWAVNSTTYLETNPVLFFILPLRDLLLAVIVLETFSLFGNAEKHLACGIPHERLAFAALISASSCMVDIYRVWHVHGSASAHRWFWLRDPHFSWWLKRFVTVFTAVVKSWTLQRLFSQVQFEVQVLFGVLRFVVRLVSDSGVCDGNVKKVSNCTQCPFLGPI